LGSPCHPSLHLWWLSLAERFSDLSGLNQFSFQHFVWWLEKNTVMVAASRVEIRTVCFAEKRLKPQLNNAK